MGKMEDYIYIYATTIKLFFKKEKNKVGCMQKLRLQKRKKKKKTRKQQEKHNCP